MKQPELLEFLEFFNNDYKQMEDLDESIDKGLEAMIDKYMNPENKLNYLIDKGNIKNKLKPITNRLSLKNFEKTNANPLTQSWNKKTSNNSNTKLKDNVKTPNNNYRDKNLNEKEVNLLFEKSMMILKDHNYNIDEIDKSATQNGKNTRILIII